MYFEDMSSNIERVIVTGASSGIGFDAARRFAELGCRVILNGRDAQKLDRARASLERPDRVIAVAGAIGDPETGKRLARAAEEHMGGVDVLVNNAGIFRARPFLETTDADLDALYETNVKGTFLVTRAIAPLLVAAGGGAIINVGAVLVEQPIGTLPCAAAMATKGGIHALTRSLAVELAPHKVRVNCVAPGIIRTPLIGEGASELAGLALLKRVGEVDETTDAILYLARAAFVTGTVLDVDGGYGHGR